MATSLLRLDPEAYACTVALSGFVVDPQLAEPQLRELFTRDDDVARVKISTSTPRCAIRVAVCHT